MSSEAHLRAQYEGALKETKLLKQNINTLEKENWSLKRSVYELSVRLDSLKESGEWKDSAYHDIFEYFDLNTLLSSSKEGVVSHDARQIDNKKNMPSHNERLRDEQPGKIFYSKSELKGHAGAVYSVKFSPSGRMLASGSFDHRVLLWDATKKFNQQHIAALTQHQRLVIDLSWSNDSNQLLSGSYDHTIKLWDVGKTQCLDSFNVEGYVQTVSFNPSENHIFFVGTSQKQLHTFDVRTGVSLIMNNDSMINTLHVSPDGQFVITGDSKGMIKTWDIRKQECITELSYQNDNGHNPISSLTASPNENGIQGDEDGRYLAVNSYDNSLRVYERSHDILHQPHHHNTMQLRHFFMGHQNKNWPIKCSFYHGFGQSYKIQLPNTSPTTSRTPSSTSMENPEDEIERSPHTDPHHNEKPLLLATGSANHKIFIYNATPQQLEENQTLGNDGEPPKSRNSILQILEGHTDRVYCVQFHPDEPILASASADSTIRIWAPKSYSR